MILKKKYLTLFYKTLAVAKSNVEENYISLADARVRDALATKVIYDLLRDFEEARKKIYVEFCNKNEAGEPDLIDDKYQFENSVVDKVNKELVTLENEEVEIEISNPEKVKQLLNNTKYAPEIGETVLIDELIALIA